MTFDCRFAVHEMYRTIAISIEQSKRMEKFRQRISVGMLAIITVLRFLAHL